MLNLTQLNQHPTQIMLANLSQDSQSECEPNRIELNRIPSLWYEIYSSLAFFLYKHFNLFLCTFVVFLSRSLCKSELNHIRQEKKNPQHTTTATKKRQYDTRSQKNRFTFDCEDRSWTVALGMQLIKWTLRSNWNHALKRKFNIFASQWSRLDGGFHFFVYCWFCWFSLVDL